MRATILFQVSEDVRNLDTPRQTPSLNPSGTTNPAGSFWRIWWCGLMILVVISEKCRKLVGFGTHFVVDPTADSQPRSNWQETFCTLSIFSEQFK